MYLKLDASGIRKLWENGHRCNNAAASGTEIVGGKPTGVVRVSLGAMTTMANVDTFIEFLKEEFMSGAIGTYGAATSQMQIQSEEQQTLAIASTGSLPPTSVTNSRPASRGTTASNSNKNTRPTVLPRRDPVPVSTAQQTEIVRADFESVLSFKQNVEPEVSKVRKERKGLSLWRRKPTKQSVACVVI